MKMKFTMRYLPLMCLLSISFLAIPPAMATAHAAPLDLDLRTVMHPHGVTHDEWQAMFEDVRSSIREQESGVNAFIDLFNGYFATLQQTALDEHKREYSQSHGEDLVTHRPRMQLHDLPSKESVEDVIKALSWVWDMRLFLIARVAGLYFKSTEPIGALLSTCRALLNAFKTPLTPLQYVQAEKAHGTGIKGKGASVIIIEDSLICDHAFLKASDRIRIDESGNALNCEEAPDHGAHVTGIVHQLAPEADILVARHATETLLLATSTQIINTSYAERLPTFHLLLDKEKNPLRDVITTDSHCGVLHFYPALMWAINKTIQGKKRQKDCFGYITQHTAANGTDDANTVMAKAAQQSYDDAQAQLHKYVKLFQGKLRILSFGNFYRQEEWRHYALPSLVTEDTFLSQTILVINITRENRLFPSSNRPDETLKELMQDVMEKGGTQDARVIDQQLRKVQEASLCAVGTHVWSAGAHNSYEWHTGTSMAAPMVTGVAALIEGEHPDFCANDIRECLLYAAKRTFVIGEGESAIHVVDLPQDQIQRLREEERGGRQYAAFDPAQYGRGILDAHAALQYASFKAAHPSAPIDVIVHMMQGWAQTRD